MKRLLFATALGFFFIAAPIYVKYSANPVYINGNLLGNAVMINGNLALPLEDIARSISGTPNLSEAGLNLRGGTLTLSPAVQKSNSSDTFTRTRHQDFHFTIKSDKSSPALAIVTQNGKSFLPLSELGQLFGNQSFTAPRNVPSGQAIQLNFTANPNAIIAVR